MILDKPIWKAENKKFRTKTNTFCFIRRFYFHSKKEKKTQCRNSYLLLLTFRRKTTKRTFGVICYLPKGLNSHFEGIQEVICWLVVLFGELLVENQLIQLTFVAAKLKERIKVVIASHTNFALCAFVQFMRLFIFAFDKKRNQKQIVLFDWITF